MPLSPVGRYTVFLPANCRKMAKNGKFRSKMVLYGLKLHFFENFFLKKMDKIGQKLTKNGQKWLILVKNVQNHILSK